MPTPPTPPKSLDDMPLAAYGGTGMEDEGATDPSTDPSTAAIVAPPAGADAARPVGAPPAADTPEAPDGPDALPIPEDEASPRVNPLARLQGARPILARVVQTFRTSRVAAGAGFAVVTVVG